MLNNPYCRIYRENKYYKKNEKKSSKLPSYVQSKYYCDTRLDLIRYYKILEKEFLNIINYIEPNIDNLQTFSVENAKLLISVCVEVENNLKGILLANGYKKKKDNYNMIDYSQLEKCLYLSQYELEFNLYYFKYPFVPFIFDKAKKKYDLFWYQSYNNLKHDRTKNIKEASLKNLIYALGGLYTLLYAQFGLYCDCANDEKISIFKMDHGGYNQFNSSSIFEITKKPKISDDESYYFEWNDDNDNGEFFKQYFKK